MRHLNLSRPACGSHRKVRGEIVKVVPSIPKLGAYIAGYKVARDRFGHESILIDGSINGVGDNFKKGTKVWIQVCWSPSFSLPFVTLRGGNHEG